jgi:hypothetical protein
MTKIQRKRRNTTSSYLLIISWLGIRFVEREVYNKTPDETALRHIRKLLNDKYLT